VETHHTHTLIQRNINTICELDKMELTGDQRSVLLDFCVHNIMFARRNSMDDEKVSTFFSIMKDILEKSMGKFLIPSSYECLL
jgi:S-adenosylmethionine:diacylglycerol 3-amino-3-carboxypropyl transferase